MNIELSSVGSANNVKIAALLRQLVDVLDPPESSHSSPPTKPSTETVRIVEATKGEAETLESVKSALLNAPYYPISDSSAFKKISGYALYGLRYNGTHPFYRKHAQATANGEVLFLYLGKTEQGKRSHGYPVKSADERMSEHRSTLKISGLPLEHFLVHCIPVQDPSAWEGLLIKEFNPIWNPGGSLNGFGWKTSDFKEKGCSPWDECHPGRYAKWLASTKQSTSVAKQGKHGKRGGLTLISNVA